MSSRRGYPAFLHDSNGGHWINVAFNFGDGPLLPTPEEFAKLLADGASIIIARPMTPGEVALLGRSRASGDEESFSFIITKDEQRWLPPRRRGH